MDQSSSMDGSGSDIELITMAAMEDEAEKRAHHNALERKRRDHIKDSFYCLRDAVPQLRGEKASRALILNKATDYIKCLKSKNICHKKEIDDIKKQNDVLEQEIDRIMKINNSMGKDRLDIQKPDDIMNPSKTDYPSSTPPTFTRITEKEKGPFIGKRDLDRSEDNIDPEKIIKGGTSVKKIQLRHFTTTGRNVGGNGDLAPGQSNPVTGATGAGTDGSGTTKTVVVATTTRPEGLKQEAEDERKPLTTTQTINIAKLKGSTGAIKIPASALAKALPNGLKNVFYQQAGSTNKPIRLQIITPDGKTKTARLISPNAGIAVPIKKAPGDKEEVKSEIKEEKLDSPVDPPKSEHSQADTKTPTTGSKDKLNDDDMKLPCNPINQPLYAKFKIVPVNKMIGSGSSTTTATGSTATATNSSGASRTLTSKQVDENKKREQEIGAMSEFDSYKNIPIPEPGKVEPVPVRYPGRNYPRDHSGMATISESELAFLTRPSNKVTSDSPKKKDPLCRGGPIATPKIEHGNIPILYKGSLISERDKELDSDLPQPTQLLLGARATDGSKPFACHICGKSFNMLSSLKVHEHIHVPVKKKPYPCDLCHRSFMTLRILSQHKESHYGRISNFHRRAALCKPRQSTQNSIGKRATFNYATHLQNTKVTSGHNPHSPRTSIPNIFSVNAGDGNAEKKPAVVSNFPRTFSPSPSPKSGPQRALPTTKVRQGQVIVQARAGGFYRSKASKNENSEDGKVSKTNLLLKRAADKEFEEKRQNKVIIYDTKITVP